MNNILAAIDIGTYTARLLVAQKLSATFDAFSPLARKRVYIRLAEGCDQADKLIIPPPAFHRTIGALKEFLEYIKFYNAESVLAVATGVVREALNQIDFIAAIYQQTGIRVRIISGHGEAYLMGKGVLSALAIEETTALIFDLGGGSTEFLSSKGDLKHSIPLGAMVLSKKYFKSDPPTKSEFQSLANFMEKSLTAINRFVLKEKHLIGTGGTVTTLAAMLYNIPLEDINPERINGLIIKREQLDSLFYQLSTLSLDNRASYPGLDLERADIVLAGFLFIIKILHIFKFTRFTACLSGILEGLLIDHFNGEVNE